MIAERSPWDGPEFDDGDDVNGCTGVPDFGFRKCCNRHDRDYGKGGGVLARIWADIRLMHCIWCFGHWLLAPVFFIGVRCFGWWFWGWTTQQKNAWAAGLWFVAGTGVGAGGHLLWELIR